jgi:tetratricopeptide (TPR) repeat protein
MSEPLTASEAAQLDQTIEMFEVITQSQPLDYQSLEILKEAYFKLGREPDVINTSKRIAQAYVQLGQLSSAILEYESILQRHPEDPDVQAALAEIENRANSITMPVMVGEPEMAGRFPSAPRRTIAPAEQEPLAEVEDGRALMSRIFVEGRFMTDGEFNLHWPRTDLREAVDQAPEPFVQVLHDKGVMPLEKSLKLLCDKARVAYLPLEKYDVDLELVRRMPRETCLRWCVLPFDRMSKSVMVATANPFNKQAAIELDQAGTHRLIWYLAKPAEIAKLLRKVFR